MSQAACPNVVVVVMIYYHVIQLQESLKTA